MMLICNDVYGIYVWVDSDNSNLELSPHFDYEQDAIEWKNKITQLIKG